MSTLSEHDSKALLAEYGVPIAAELLVSNPADARTDRIPGDVAIAGAPQPGWGIHLVDMNIAQGDLIRVVQAQSAALRHAGH